MILLLKTILKKKKYDEDNEVIPIEALDDNNGIISPRYLIHVKMLVLKKLKIKWNPERQKIHYQIIDDATEKKKIVNLSNNTN